MQSDLFDKKVREAADHHYPAYDEHAWKKMKGLLDTHMPEKEDRRRRPILFLLFFLALGGGIWFLTRPSGGTQETEMNSPTTEGNESPAAGATRLPGTTGNSEDPVDLPVTNTTGTSTVVTGSPTTSGTELLLQPVRQPVRTRSSGENTDRIATNKNQPVRNENGRVTENPEWQKTDPGISVNPPAQAPQKLITRTAEKLAMESEEKIADADKTLNPEVKKETAAEEPVAETDKKNNEDPGKKKPSLASRFFFYGSVGADLSFTKQAGQTRVLSGVGAGFQVGERFTVRSGFFVARKVYSAKPEEYDPPENFWNYYPNMQKIEANCKVYEVPLLVSYNFGRSDKQAWMATVGVSSFFMKEEKYKYFYKPTPTSQTTTRDYMIENRFEHHLSVITLSGGYKRDLGKRVTVMAEPYLKLPVQGVGFGKVKLNSAGVMVSVGIKPFGN